MGRPASSPLGAGKPGTPAGPAHVHPDGGYGWVIVMAYSLNIILVIQIVTVFGLIFKDLFRELGMPAADIATIMNLNIAFSLLMGLFVGPLIRRWSYRRVAAGGVVLAGIGLVLTSFSSNFVEFLLNYGIIMSSGMGLASPSFSVALHTYFRLRRSLATGLAMTFTGVAGIVLPQLVSLSLAEYGARGTCLLFAGLAFNGLVASTLLQPVKWHRPATRAPRTSELQGVVEDEQDPMLDNAFALPPLPVVKEETDSELDRLGLGFSRRRTSTISSYHTARRPSETTLWASASVLDLGCSSAALDELVPRRKASATLLASKDQHSPAHGPAPGPADSCSSSSSAPCYRRWWRFLVDMFDLTLLTNPSNLNLMMGMSLAFFSETNFTQFVPFILADRGLDTQQIATIMSVMSVADTASKLGAPFLHAALRQSSRVMYVGSLVLLIAGRTALVLLRGDSALMGVAVVLGSCKGLRSVFYYQVIPDSVPLERMASAISLQAMLNGIIFLVIGPLIGIIRDHTGNYDLVILACNALTLVCVALWLVEFVVKAVARTRSKR